MASGIDIVRVQNLNTGSHYKGTPGLPGGARRMHVRGRNLESGQRRKVLQAITRTVSLVGGYREAVAALWER